MGTNEGGGARRRLDAVFLGAKDYRHHSYRNAASMDLDHSGLTRRCKISIGHMRAREGKRSATPAIAVGDTDIAAFKELQKLGIELEIRYLPSSAPDPIGNLFN